MLAVIDEHESAGHLGALSSGMAVLEAVSGGARIEWGQDDRSFVALLLFPWVGETAIGGRTPRRA